jgi:dihydrodipicolinate synthase/N-acetylneuraminate lyase
MSLPGTSLHDVFTPIVTSFGADGAIACDKIAANLDRWNRTGLRGYSVLGFNGKWVFLAEAERPRDAGLGRLPASVQVRGRLAWAPR